MLLSSLFLSSYKKVLYLLLVLPSAVFPSKSVEIVITTFPSRVNSKSMQRYGVDWRKTKERKRFLIVAIFTFYYMMNCKATAWSIFVEAAINSQTGGWLHGSVLRLCNIWRSTKRTAFLNESTLFADDIVFLFLLFA